MKRFLGGVCSGRDEGGGLGGAGLGGLIGGFGNYVFFELSDFFLDFFGVVDVLLYRSAFGAWFGAEILQGSGFQRCGTLNL